MSFPNKDERKRCNMAREEFWSCLDRHNITDTKIPNECLALRKVFESNCPGQWVKHFDRKRQYELFREKMSKGYDPLETSQQK